MPGEVGFGKRIAISYKTTFCFAVAKLETFWGKALSACSSFYCSIQLFSFVFLGLLELAFESGHISVILVDD